MFFSFKLSSADVRELEHYAYYDELTGALRRWVLFKILKKWEKQRKDFAVIYADFDDFKPINDTFGHATGDAVLVHFVKQAREYLKGEEFYIGRMGGDEFLIVVARNDFCHPEGIRAGLELRCIDVPYVDEKEGTEIPLCVSAGYAIYCGGIDLTVQQADRQLYYSKGNKQKRWVRYDEQRNNK